MLLHGCPLLAAEKVADRVLISLADPVMVEGHRIPVAASIGVAEGVELEDLLRRADHAMYVVKHSCKDAWGSDTSVLTTEVC
jgi:diguanylate cyclase